jgi:precorrin-8X/cobalt-precorrin-8 methylmutase
MIPTHPILEQSFAIIDQEIGEHSFSPEEYAIVRRVIHSTADFEFKHLIRFSPGVIEAAIAAITQRVPIITDVNMVKQGVINLVKQTFDNPLISAVDQAITVHPGKTRTETGLLQCLDQFPNGIYVIGNAPTALLALCEHLKLNLIPPAPLVEGGTGGGGSCVAAQKPNGIKPSLIIGAPVGLVSVVESKAALAGTSIPQIRIAGRKGGSSVAAAILNALLILAWNRQEP